MSFCLRDSECTACTLPRCRLVPNVPKDPGQIGSRSSAGIKTVIRRMAVDIIDFHCSAEVPERQMKISAESGASSEESLRLYMELTVLGVARQAFEFAGNCHGIRPFSATAGMCPEPVDGIGQLSFVAEPVSNGSRAAVDGKKLLIAVPMGAADDLPERDEDLQLALGIGEARRQMAQCLKCLSIIIAGLSQSVAASCFRSRIDPEREGLSEFACVH